MNRLFSYCLAAAYFLCGDFAAADVFGSGPNAFQIDFVMIGNPGNPPDANPNPAGAVPYEYRIGKYEISEHVIDKANALGGLGITKDTRGPDKPATSVSWYEAARFVNWLNTSTGSVPAYKFDASGNFQLWAPSDPGYDAANLYRNKLARYFLPSINEWHKAAYYDGLAGAYYDYPTGSDSVDAVFYDGASNSDPNVITNVGLLGPYGSAGQGGNVDEWNETAFDRVNNIRDEHRSVVGGSWDSFANVLKAEHTGGGVTPTFDGNHFGFRVAGVIPEPNAFVLTGAGILTSLAMKPRRRKSL
jgi:hypothetical protein